MVTRVIDEYWGAGRNDLNDAAGLYLPTKIGNKNLKIKVGKLQSQEKLTTELPQGEEVIDVSQNIIVKWRFCQESKTSIDKTSNERRRYELSFPKKASKKNHA